MDNHHAVDAFAAQHLLCKLSDDRRLLEPPLAAFRQTAEPRPQINYMTCPF